jgi:hypothetical protein|tara:strand:+ start:917 stop:1105 length:189 start_codon:yes stop_codon:yes gene_type:complete
MKKSQEKFIAISMWMGLLIIIATLIVLLLPSPQETTQKQHNFPVGDDTEHTWIGGDGESFEE